MNKAAAFCIASSILVFASGCIENPASDSQLGRKKNQTAATLRFQGWEYLTLSLDRTAAGTSLKVTNPGLGTVDSAAFYLEIGAKFPDGLQPNLMERPSLEYYGRVGGLKPGESEDLGIIEREIEDNLDELYLSVFLTRIAVDGFEKGNPLGGLFSGTYSGRDTVYGIYSGAVRGLIDADGSMVLKLTEPGASRTPGQATGSVSADGTVNVNAWLVRGNYSDSTLNADPRFVTAGIGMEATFLFGKGEPWRDSLVIHLNPYNTR